MAIQGNGKTTLSKALMTQAPPFEYYFVFDPFDEYDDVPGFKFEEAFTPEEVIELFNSGKKQVRYVSGDDEDMLQLLPFLKEFDNILLVFNESDMLFENQHNPPDFKWMVNMGRHARISMILIARRPPDLPRSFTGQSFLFFSNVVEPNDIKFVKARIGAMPPRNIPQFDFYVHDFNSGELTLFSASWTRRALHLTA